MNENKMYFLVGESCFFNRFCDGNFRSKWNGLWKLTTKYLEYYAMKVNGVWLTSSQRTIEEGLEYFKHCYEVDRISIEEKLFIPEKEPALVIFLSFENLSDSDRNVNLEIETAVNIREWNENWNERDYEVLYKENCYFVKSEKGRMIFLSSERGEFIGYHFYKTHYPSNEPQRCFVTKNFSTSFFLKPRERKTITFVFACDLEICDAEKILENSTELLKKKREIYESCLRENLFHSDISYLDELFKIAVLNLKKNTVLFGGKRVLIAGYPWYTQIWGRDACLSISNFFLEKEVARDTLILLAKNSKDGVIPNFMLKDKIDYNSSDATPLFVVALKNYVFKTGEIYLIEEFKDLLLKILERYEKSKNEFGFIKSDKNSTWMDTLEREGYCLEVQVFWFAALEAMKEMFGLIEENNLVERVENLSRELKKNIVKHFKKGEDFLDVLGSDKKTLNQIFLPIFNVTLSTKNFVKKIEEEFSTEVGLSILPRNSNEYNPTLYQKGATWSHLLALLSYLQFKTGRVERGLENLRKIYIKSNELVLSALPEVWNSETGELRVEKPVGKEESAFLQTWTASSIIKAIDEGLLGLEYNSFSNVIKVSPKIEGRFVRRIRIGDDLVTLEIIFKEGRLDVNFESRLKKEYKVVAIE
ncbi:MAG: amylo-alpha-1,6-glucosidase [Candidatus Aenigmarchaeota archaeon]|nr:hypothetical protein [Candidatus Aenigmarchaeota archaeon]MDW8159924.1 amylo-alpha-1,6-glucosidase [Candidatus Aenigmarchaeota archaeon]